LVAPALHADHDPLEPAEKAAGDWIKIRLEATRLESEWLTDRPLLESTVEGLKQRAATLEEKRDHLKASTARDREEIDTMKAKNRADADDLRDVDSRLRALSRGLIDLRPSLPPRLSEALDLLYRSLGAPGIATGARMQIAMTMLNRCAQFNRTITYGEEVLSIDGENGQRSLEVIYWGLAHAYALDSAAGKAWYGAPGPKGWRWEPLAGSAPAVAQLIAVYSDRADPGFVPVPARLENPAAETASRATP